MTQRQQLYPCDKQLYEEFRAWQTQLYRKVQQVEPDTLCLLIADLMRTAELLDVELATQEQLDSNRVSRMTSTPLDAHTA